MIIEEREIGKYYGINREIVLIDKKVIIRFNALGNDEIDLEFVKFYDSESKAIESIKKYIEETINPTKEEKGPSNGDWKEFEVKVNTSIIQLLRDAINGSIVLPDSGDGFQLSRNTIENLQLNVDRFDNVEYIKYVTYIL